MTNKRTSILLTIGAFLFFTVAFFPVFKILTQQWLNSEDYAHAFIVLPVIAYMVWQKRNVLKEKANHGRFEGLAVVVFFIVVYLIAVHAHSKLVASISMIMTVLGTIIYTHGYQAAKELFTPFVLFLLLIPIPSSIYSPTTLPLQLKVSQASEMVVRLFSVPIFREGNVLTIPEKSFQIVQACSGMRSIISLVTLSLIIGYFMLAKKRSKLALVATSIPVAIFVNIIRVVVMILAFHYFKMDLSAGTSHAVLGIIVFLIGLAALFSFQRVIEFWETRLIRN